jgi:general stress protein 26
MNNGKEREQAVRQLRELVTGIPVALLVTAGPDGALHSRPTFQEHAQKAKENCVVSKLVSAAAINLDAQLAT